MMASAAARRWSERLDRKCAERNELSAWLASLERGPATDFEAAATVRAQLGRVLHDIEQMKVTD